nr:AVR-Pi9 [Pyricularia oryzae]
MQFSQILTVLFLGVSVSALPAGGLPGSPGSAVQRCHCPPRGSHAHGSLAAREEAPDAEGDAKISARYTCPNCHKTGKGCDDGWCQVEKTHW